VSWVWIGGLVLGLGTLIAMLPNRKSVSTRRSQVAGKEEAKEVEIAS
jgi:hypothetical protein